MFLFDDIAMSPFRGFLFIAREVAKAAEQERENQRNSLMAQLSSLHLQLEKGEISDDEFDEREQDLLDALEAMDAS